MQSKNQYEEKKTLLAAGAEIVNSPPPHEKGSYIKEKRVGEKPKSAEDVDLRHIEYEVSFDPTNQTPRSNLLSPNGKVSLELFSSGGLAVIYDGRILWWNKVRCFF